MFFPSTLTKEQTDKRQIDDISTLDREMRVILMSRQPRAFGSFKQSRG